MSEEYTNGIVIFTNKSDNSKAPTHTGSLDIGDDIVAAIKKGETNLRVALWKRTSAKGTTFLSGMVQLPYREDAESADDQVEDTDDWDEDDDF